MRVEFQIGDAVAGGDLERREQDFTLRLFERELQGEILRWEAPFFSIRQCGHVVRGAFYRNGDFVDVHLPKGNFRIHFVSSARAARGGVATGGLFSPMPGKVIQVFVKAGDGVKKGDLLMMLEAMKMEHKILSPSDGIVGRIFFREGERVGQEVELLEIQPQ